VIAALFGLILAAVTAPPINIVVDTTAAVNTIRPLHAIGVGIDSDPEGHIRALYDPTHTRRMLGAGLGVVSYRLYTELSIQDWHWNPFGTFSDAVHGRGYFTASATPGPSSIVDSFGYTLPHRGSSRDQGDDDGYSRIDDGDPNTYWKSNPYLARPFTGDPDDQHPQWVVVDFIHPKRVDAIHIVWANPYATRYTVQYWTGGDAILAQASGRWHTFPNGGVERGSGGTALLRLSSERVTTRFLRVLMTASSNTCDTHGSADRRNCLGYAIYDIGAGTIDKAGGFHDLIRRTACGGDPERRSMCGPRQTPIMVSSIDPWHTSADRVRSGQDQPGLDFVSRNAITRGLPMMYPVPLFYSTPQNAVNEVRYLQSRGYPLDHIEVGEEVDGQYAMPEDYAALYVQWARAIHAVVPHAELGGPVFQGVNADIKVWADASGDDSWLRRFLDYLRSHGHLGDLAFMSFEHYPFRGCDQGVTLRMDLLREPAIMRGVVDAWHADGLPPSVPMYVTEANFANNGGPVPHQIEGALWQVDWIATFLTAGGAGVNHYQYEAEPQDLSHRCGPYGNYSMFITDERFRILANAAQFYGSQMLTQAWLEPGDRPHELYAAKTDQTSKNPSVTAYAAKRPDGTWSVLLVNKDREAHVAHIAFSGDDGVQVLGPTSETVFGQAQYQWAGRSATELPNPDTGPLISKNAGSTGAFVLPPLSIVVIRGALGVGASQTSTQLPAPTPLQRQ